MRYVSFLEFLLVHCSQLIYVIISELDMDEDSSWFSLFTPSLFVFPNYNVVVQNAYLVRL